MNPKKQKLLIWLVTLIALGLATRVYNGPGDSWIKNKLAGSIYVVFWCYMFSYLFIRKAPGLICLAVLLATICIEFTQLISTPVLNEIRTNFIGRTLIGNSFSLKDIPYYVLGSFFSYINLFCLHYR